MKRFRMFGVFRALLAAALLVAAFPGPVAAIPPSYRAVVLGQQPVAVNPVPGYVTNIVQGFASSPDAGRQACISGFVTTLYTAGAWSKLDALYVLAAGEDQGSRINWKAPGTFNASKVGTGGSFTTDIGWSGFSSGNYLSTGYDPNTAGGQISRNLNVFFAATTTDTNDASSAFMAGNTLFSMQSRTNGGAIASRNSSSSLDTGAANTGAGLYMTNRSGSTTYDRYKNGVLVDSPTRTSLAPVSATIYIGTHNALQFSTKTVNLVGFGTALDAAQISAVWDGYSAYMTCIGQSAT